jgi:DNA repair exonuclease SbcCD ATPase subunit
MEKAMTNAPALTSERIAELRQKVLDYDWSDVVDRATLLSLLDAVERAAGAGAFPEDLARASATINDLRQKWKEAEDKLAVIERTRDEQTAFAYKQGQTSVEKERDQVEAELADANRALNKAWIETDNLQAKLADLEKKCAFYSECSSADTARADIAEAKLATVTADRDACFESTKAGFAEYRARVAELEAKLTACREGWDAALARVKEVEKERDAAEASWAEEQRAANAAELECEALKAKLQRAEAVVLKLTDLLRHCWVHEMHPRCGFDQMTTEQKAIYQAIASGDGWDGGPKTGPSQALSDAGQNDEKRESDQ